MNIEDSLIRNLQFYYNMPTYLRYFLGYLYRMVPLSLRYGNKINNFFQLIELEKKFSAEEILDYQLTSLRNLIGYVYKHVPYYQKSLNFSDRNITNFNDFHKLPFLTKNEVRENTSDLISNEFSKDELIEASTSGSTGEPLLLYYEKGIVRARELVFMNDQWSRIGYKFGDRLAVFRSAYVKNREKNNLWEYEPIKNRFIYSSYDLTPAHMPKIIKHLRKTKPAFLWVYPSSLTILANFMKEQNYPPISSIKGILSGSENAFPSQIRLFKQVFNCPTYRWYGLAECVALGGSCEHSNDYHCYSTYSYVELINESGEHVKNIGEKGEIIGTTFDIFSMPLVRYRTGDYAYFGGDKCDKCGRIGLLFQEIEGREQETIVDKYGNRHSLGPYLFGIHEKFWANVSAIQFYQKAVGKLVIYVVSYKLEKNALCRYVSDLFENKFKNNFDIEVVPTKETLRNSSGKHKYLIQDLKLL